MWDFVYGWRGEIVSVVAVLGTYSIFRFVFHQRIGRMMIGGMLLGLAIEFSTEPEWNYSLKCYIWRDVSPFVIMGWGAHMTWLVLFSEYLFKKIFGAEPGNDFRLLITDVLAGVPILTTGELLGLHVLKIWNYDACLNWHTMIPVIQYPVEAIAPMIALALGVPSVLRFWRGPR
jgi:hypothetical protein